MNKSEVIDRVCELLSDKSGAMRQLASSWVGIVLADIASRGLLQSLKVELPTQMLTPGIRKYGFDHNVDQYFGFFVPQYGYPDGVLERVDDYTFMAMMMSDGITTRGRPKYYNIFGNRDDTIENGGAIRVHPLPIESAITYVWQYMNATALGDNDEIAEIKLNHIPTLIYGAYSMGAVFDSVLTAADSTAKYERGIARIMMNNHIDLGRAHQVKYQGL